MKTSASSKDNINHFWYLSSLFFVFLGAITGLMRKLNKEVPMSSDGRFELCHEMQHGCLLFYNSLTALIQCLLFYIIQCHYSMSPFCIWLTHFANRRILIEANGNQQLSNWLSFCKIGHSQNNLLTRLTEALLVTTVMWLTKPDESLVNLLLSVLLWILSCCQTTWHIMKIWQVHFNIAEQKD